MIEIRGIQNGTRNDPQLNVLHWRAATAPHKHPRLAKLKDPPGGVYDDVGCATRQS